MNQPQSKTKDVRTNPWLLVGRILFTVALLGTMVFIFSNSVAVAGVSNQASGRVMNLLYALFDRFGLSSLRELFTMRFIRKLAHFAEYALLGFWWMLCLQVYTRHFVKHISWPMLACLLTALADETIQLYASGRSSQVTDVWLDYVGSLTGLVCGLLILCFCRMVYLLVKYRDKE